MEEDATSKAVQELVVRDTNDDGGGDEEEEEECDAEAWEMLSKCFREVQTALDQNRALIQEVNENQRSKVPDKIARNVALIREINGNIARVVELYSDLSVYFASLVRRRRATATADRRRNAAGDQVTSADS